MGRIASNQTLRLNCILYAEATYIAELPTVIVIYTLSFPNRVAVVPLD